MDATLLSRTWACQHKHTRLARQRSPVATHSIARSQADEKTGYRENIQSIIEYIFLGEYSPYTLILKMNRNIICRLQGEYSPISISFFYELTMEEYSSRGIDCYQRIENILFPYNEFVFYKMLRILWDWKWNWNIIFYH